MTAIMKQQPIAQDLIARARRQDREAFDRLIELQKSRLSLFVKYRLRAPLSNQVEVEDVVQDVFVRAFQGIERFHGKDDEESFFRWLTGIATNVVLELASQHGRKQAGPLEYEVADSAVSQSKALLREERFSRLKAVLESLPPDYREVIRLARLRRLPIKEVAQHLGRTPEATTQLLWRAIQKLRVSFGDTDSLHLPQRSLDEEGGDQNG